MTKACTKCKEEKPLQAFHRSAASKTGRRDWCKACVAAYMRRRSERLGREAREWREAALREQAERVALPPARCLHSFTFELQPGEAVRFLDIPGDLTREQADKLKRIVSAYVAPDPGHHGPA